MGEFYQLYLPLILLLRAGDIETNPGPITSESLISELEILQLSKEINPAYYNSLGTSLGIKIEQHHDNYDAFLSVLMEWNADKQPPDINKRELLAENLQSIGLEDLSDKLRSGSLIQSAPYAPTDPTESPVDSMSPELIERCRKDFMLKYKTTLCRIRSDPLNPDSLVQLQEIYTNLVLEEEEDGRAIRELEYSDPMKFKVKAERGTRELEYDDLLNVKVKGRIPKRFLIQGEAGAGKTTLCAKIAWDWMNGTHYQQFAWLLIVPLRESENYTMGEIAKSYLQEDNPTTAAQLTHYIHSNPNSVLTVYDGLDEFKRKLEKKGENGMKGDAFTQKPRKHRSTRDGNDTRQEYSRPPGSHIQEQSFYTHPDGFNKESGAQQSCENTETQGDEIGRVIQQPDSFTKDTGGDFTQRTDDYTERADDSFTQPKGYPEGQGIHSHEQASFSEPPGPSTAHSGLHTRNPLGYTQHHKPEYHNCELVIEDIIWCNQLTTAVVLITTRPWKAREIRMDTDISNEYAFIRVDGFTEENMSTYIHRYFSKDEARANDLIEFIKENGVLSENMARYPIFVAMLCLMWKEIKVEKKQTIKSLQTYSQFFGEMFMFLKEHYVQKITEDLSPSSLDRLINETSVLLKPIAELAFTGLLENTLIFDERPFQDCQNSKAAACRVGILSQENRIAPVVDRKERKSQSIVFFPHKLFQEYMAGVHLASLYDTDYVRYNNLMISTILPRGEFFRYLLYFTASQNKTVGFSVMTHMVNRFEERTGILADVAFESNDPDAVAVVQLSTTPKREFLDIEYRMTSHTIAGYASVGVDVVDLHISKSCGKTVSRDVGRIICSSPSLNTLTIKSKMHNDFYAFLAKESPNIKVTKLRLHDIFDELRVFPLSPSALRDLAEALCSMPHLNDLTFKSTCPHDDFYLLMKEKASHIKVTKLCLNNVSDCEGYEKLSSSASRDLAEVLCSMPHLNDLTLKDTRPHDDFYSLMKEKVTNIKITKLRLEDIPTPYNFGYVQLYSSASRDMAEVLCSMPHMNDLTLKNIHPHDDFYSVMREKASDIKITTLCLEDIPDHEAFSELSSPASRDLAEALFSMPHLNDLTLNNTRPHDDFFSVMKEKASNIKVTGLRLVKITDTGKINKFQLSSSASRDLAEALCYMPHLNDLTLNNTSPHDDFFSVMKEKASHIKVIRLSLVDIPDKCGYIQRLSSSASRDLAAALCFMPHLNDLTLETIRAHKNFHAAIKERATLAKGCFPQVAEGHFRLNGVIQQEIQSLLNSLKKIIRFRYSPIYYGPYMKGDKNSKEETDASEEEEKGFIESGDEEKTDYSHPVDEESKTSHEGDEVEDDPEKRNPEQIEEKSDDVRDDEESKTSHEGGEVEDDPEERNPEQSEEKSDDVRDDEESKTSHEGDEIEDDPEERNHEQSKEKSGDVRDDEENKTSHEGDEVEDDPEERNPEQSEEKSGDVRDDEESRTSHGGNEVEDDSSESNPEQSDEKSDDVKDYEESAEDMKDGNHVEGLFDHQGGELSLSNHDCILRIPPGALEEGSPTKITLEVLTELPDDLELEDDEMVVSSGFKCLPSGLHFKKPVKLIMPHCAVIHDPGRVKTFLHSWSHEIAGKIKRIPQTPSTCKVHHSHFELMLEHFSSGWLTMFWDWLSGRGKLMCCMPYLPNTMPPNRKPLMELRLQNKPSQALIYKKGDNFQPALDEDDVIMIERQDLTITCDHAEEGNEAEVIKYSRLFNTPKCKASFNLDLRDVRGNTTVTLKLTQIDTQKIMFDTVCIEEARSQNLHASPSSSSSEKDDVRDLVTDEALTTLSTHVPHDKYTKLSGKLGIEYNEAQNILSKHGSDYKKAIRDCFAIWKDKSGGSLAVLGEILRSSELFGLWKKYLKLD